MKEIPPPAGFVARALPCGRGWFQARWADEIAAAIGKSTIPVIEQALASKDSQRFRGRSRVSTWNSPALSAPLVARRCGHGGFWRHFSADRYLNDRRARIEIEHARRILDAGIDTPEIAGVVFYKSGIFQRMDFLTVLVPQSLDLVAFLAAGPSLAQMAGATSAVRALLSRCAQHGLIHRDLNARNILLSNIDQTLRAHMLDVEDVEWTSRDSQRARLANHARLARSLRKRSSRGDFNMPPQQLQTLISQLESHG